MNMIAFVIATKDRPAELRRTLKSLEDQTVLPDEVVIVNGGLEPLNDVIGEFPRLPIKDLACRPPSATRQRNRGVQAVRPDIGLAGFLDDDIELEKDAVEKMLAFWDTADLTVGGAAFNMANHPRAFAASLKSLSLLERWGFYSSRIGRVPPSGFQTMIGYVRRTAAVQWLSSCAVVFRKEIFREFQFDEWFTEYSYLEDLDFSYRVGQKYRLAVVADARYYHYPGETGRGNGLSFGRREVRNRLYFVRKNKEFSVAKCYIALLFRVVISLTQAIKNLNIYYFQRAWGNILGLAESLKGR